MTRRLLEESYVALGRYERRLEEPSDELEAVRDLKMRLEPALGAGAGEVACPACSRVYHQHPADAEANSRAESCDGCPAETVCGESPTNALLAGRPPWTWRAISTVLSPCRECRRNVVAAGEAGEAGEADTPACSGCRATTRAEEEEGATA